MKTIKWFTDTETTGLLKELEQILTYSVVLEEGDKTIDAYERSILLKDNVLPSPGALLVNKINPFSSAYKNKAELEYLAYSHLKNLFVQYKNAGYRVVMIAYNLEFDWIMYSDLFAKFGDKLDNYISVKFDPLTTARQLVEQGKIITKEIQTTFSKTYKSAKLEDVYLGLGFEASGFKAHTALDDTLMLQMAAHGIYALALGGKTLDSVSASPDSYTVGQIVHIVTDDEKLGLTKKYLKVLLNDLENQRLLILDDQATMAGDPVNAVRFAPYGEILDELDCPANQITRIEGYYQTNQQVITEAANALLAKKEKKVTVLDFQKVIDLAEKMKAAPNKKEAYKNLTEEEIELLPKAENYCFGKYNEGWSRELGGPNYLTKVHVIKLSTQLSVGCDPMGVYRLMQNGEEVLVTEKRTEMQEKIMSLMGVDKDNENFKSLLKTIPATSKFKNDKHPKKLLEEFDNKKAEVYQGADKFKKDLMTDLLGYLKKKSPEVFGEVSVPTFKLDLSALLKKKE
jgi:DNA polymerase III epsilon subunit-like protein